MCLFSHILQFFESNYQLFSFVKFLKNLEKYFAWLGLKICKFILKPVIFLGKIIFLIIRSTYFTRPTCFVLTLKILDKK